MALWGVFAGPGTLCETDSGRGMVCFAGGKGGEDFSFPEDRCGHIAGSCSCLTAFPVLPPPFLPTPLFLKSCLGGTGNSGQGTSEDNHGVLMAVSFLLPGPTARLASWGRCRPRLAVPVVYTRGSPREERTASGSRPRSSRCLRSHGWTQEPLRRAPLPPSSIALGVVALLTPSSGSESQARLPASCPELSPPRSFPET